MMARAGHELTTTQAPDMHAPASGLVTVTASCSCGKWMATAYVGGLHEPFDVVSSWERHLAEAAGIPPELMTPEPVKHTLSPVAIDADRLVKVACSCGDWHGEWEEGPLAPRWLDVEHAHRVHATGTGARLSPPQFPPAPTPALDSLIAAARAMADSGAGAAKALEEFTDAHAAGKANGVGVLVTRRPDGTVASTPNVYLAPGVVLYADDPGGPWKVPAPSFVDARAPFEGAWLPTYLRDVA